MQMMEMKHGDMWRAAIQASFLAIHIVLGNVLLP